jgi:hypothetical protein
MEPDAVVMAMGHLGAHAISDRGRWDGGRMARAPSLVLHYSTTTRFGEALAERREKGAYSPRMIGNLAH